MRTLKKTLCLALALVLMLGLCAVGASATSFNDDAQIEENYREAIEVLEAIGVYQGKGDGVLGPKDVLTRVQGCYLVCKMLKMPNGAGFTSFTDVSAADNGVVAYCQNLGLVHGYGDNTFHPDEPLTGAAFAKFCLAALGYNCDVEGIMGDNWAAATLQVATSAGLTDGLVAYDQNASMTREQAGQMLLNTLKARMVHYTGNTTITGGDGLNITVHGERQYTVSTSDEDFRLSNNRKFSDVSAEHKTGDGYVQFAELYFPLLKMDDVNTSASSDSMFIPLHHTWTYAGVTVYKVLADPVINFTSKMNSTAVSSALSNYYMSTISAEDDAAEVATPSGVLKRDTNYYINNAGTSINDVTALNFTTNITVNGTNQLVGNTSGDNHANVVGNKIQVTGKMSLANVIADLTQNGREVTLYATQPNKPNQINEIVITCYTVAKVKDITTSGNTTRYKFEVKKDDLGVDIAVREVYADAPDDSRLLSDTALAKGDWVTLTYAGNGYEWNAQSTPLLAFGTTAVSGTQTEYTNNTNKVVIDGTSYDIGTGVIKNGVADRLDYNEFTANKAGTFFFDQFGYLVSSDTTATPKYAFIVNATGSVSTSYDGQTPTIKVLAVLSDGTYGEYNVKVEKQSNIANNQNKKRDGIKFPDGDTKNDYIYNIDNTYGTDANPAEGTDWYIANTNILVLSNETDYIVNNPGETDPQRKTTDDAAKILMSDAYGYVYEYTLDNNTITLSPLAPTPLSNGVTAYSNTPLTANVPGTGVAGVPAVKQSYSGQTTSAIQRARVDYIAALDAVGLYNGGTVLDSATSYDAADKTYATPGKVISSSHIGDDTRERAAYGGGAAPGPKARVVVDRDTPIVIFDSKAATNGTVVTGISSLPTIPSESAIGYFAGKADNGGQITTDVIFISRDGGISNVTKEYIYINPKNFTEEELANGDTVWKYTAYHENGDTFTVIRDSDLGKDWASDGYKNKDSGDQKRANGNAGLYLYNANNYLTSQVLIRGKDGTNTTAGQGEPLDDAHPYDHGVATRSGNVLKLNGADYYITGDTSIVYTESGNNPDQVNNAEVFIVLELVEGSRTMNIKTIYVLDTVTALHPLN